MIRCLPGTRGFYFVDARLFFASEHKMPGIPLLCPEDFVQFAKTELAVFVQKDKKGGKSPGLAGKMSKQV